MNRPFIILFGDSLTQRSFDNGGWGLLLSTSYAAKLDIFNRGYSGYNSKWVMNLLPTIFTTGPQNPPALVTIWLGANDNAALPSPQHVPLEEYKANLKYISEYIQKQYGGADNVPIVFLTPPAFEEGMWRKWCEDNKKPIDWSTTRTCATVKQYADACVAVSRELGVLSLDIHSKMLQVDDWQTLLADGLHLSKAGNEFVFKELSSFINNNIPSLNATKLGFDFPYWATIDAANPEKSFAQKN